MNTLAHLNVRLVLLCRDGWLVAVAGEAWLEGTVGNWRAQVPMRHTRCRYEARRGIVFLSSVSQPCCE